MVAPTLYCDTRMGGKKQWVYGDPREALMRVPDEIKQCVCFLCTEEKRHGETVYRYGGTGFFVGIPSEKIPDTEYIYLVTAKHCVERATQRGDLFVRINTKDHYDILKVTSHWSYSEKEGVDVAVYPFSEACSKHQFDVITEKSFVTDEVIDEYGIGIGDDVVITGLFAKRHGTQRNLPIVRVGTIAAMSDEPFEDPNSGQPYEAYLIEARSIGGLSGSPVFVYLTPPRKTTDGIMVDHYMYLLGLIRGHWDYVSQASMVDFNADERSAVNMGIALVTPIQEVLEVLQGEELREDRKRRDRESANRNAPTLDSDFGTEDHAERFLQTVKGLATTPKSEFEKAEQERKKE